MKSSFESATKATNTMLGQMGECRDNYALRDLADTFGIACLGRYMSQKLGAAMAALGVTKTARARGPEYSGI